MKIDYRDFRKFFRSIHSYDPFPWQQELVRNLEQNDEWPDLIDLPTGSGKTAVLDVAIFHLALRANTPMASALRIALVVDRRLVVDDAFSRAEKLAAALNDSLTENADGCDVVKEVARRLRKLSGSNLQKPLIVQKLRGGVPLEHDWARTPVQPTILCSTVDQVGSRLLFRGYGVSDRMKPVHAGLLGVNSLIFLDEAHISKPFRQTLDAVRRFGGADVRMVLMSATPNNEVKTRFSLSSSDRDHPELKKRLETRKPVTLKVERKKGVNIAQSFAREASIIMRRLNDRSVSPAAVGVVVNRVALARKIYEEISKNAFEFDVILLIGRSRDIDRDKILKILAPFKTHAERPIETKSLYVVATQCLEVGVDLDLDGLVTQAASLDALRQRFGRLNRAGRKILSEGTILTEINDIGKKSIDPVYGDRIYRTWHALNQLTDGNSTIDFGIDALSNRLAEVDCNLLTFSVEQPNAPVAMPTYFDLWSQTSPRPKNDPDVGLFLHGTKRIDAGVSIVWRSDIGEIFDQLQYAREGNGDVSKQVVENELTEAICLIPPRAAEAVEVPLGIARSWLSYLEENLDNISDISEPNQEERGSATNRQVDRIAFRWAGIGDQRTGIVNSFDLRPGDLLVVPSEYGGCDEFGWAPNSSNFVLDVADKAAEPYWGRRCAVRINRDIVWKESDWVKILRIFDEDLTGLDMVNEILTVLSSEKNEKFTESSGPAPRDVIEPLKALQRANGRHIEFHFPYGNDKRKGVILVAERGVKGADSNNFAAPTTEDDNLSHTSSMPISLDAHCRRVADFVARFTSALDIPEANDLVLAAELHDAGKADRRFQVMLLGGNIWNRSDVQPLAKSGRSSSPGAWERAGLPKGWRHEALSVRMARKHKNFYKAQDPELVLWLIGSHHGRGRPFFDFEDPTPEIEIAPCLATATWQLDPETPGPQSLAFDFLGFDWPSMFEDLKRRYGIWRLAHLEMILRLADHRASEREKFKS